MKWENTTITTITIITIMIIMTITSQSEGMTSLLSNQSISLNLLMILWISLANILFLIFSWRRKDPISARLIIENCSTFNNMREKCS